MKSYPSGYDLSQPVLRLDWTLLKVVKFAQVGIFPPIFAGQNDSMNTIIVWARNKFT